jgi:hypothetical protein
LLLSTWGSIVLKIACRHHYCFRQQFIHTNSKVVILHNRKHNTAKKFMHTIGKRFKRKFPPKNYHALLFRAQFWVYSLVSLENPLFSIHFRAMATLVNEFSVDNLLLSTQSFYVFLFIVCKSFSHISAKQLWRKAGLNVV